MNGSGRLAVDPNFSVRHRAVENEADDLSLPSGRDIESQAILSLLLCWRLHLAERAASVVVAAEALLLPAGRDMNLRPDAALAPARAEEIPHDCIVFAC